jgi:NAD(P)-dependent dehydrogenase (short-subunit alcohol dehydrogenase family)
MTATGDERGIVLVTGGNSGIGYECARALARDGVRVAIASRNREASEQAAQRIAAEGAPGRVESLDLDLGSLAAVRSFARDLRSSGLPIRALVCNAGLQMNRRTATPDGFETTFAVNHLGHFLLVNLLLESLVANAPARIVVVASGVHDPALRTGMPKADVRSWEALATAGGADAEGFDGRLAYVNSKLCNLWFTYELIRRLAAAGVGQGAHDPVSVNAFEPGLVPGSGLARDYPPALRFLWDHVGPPLAAAVSRWVTTINTAEHSGRALAGVVRNPTLERTSGQYFPSHTRFAAGRSSELSYDEDRARELWDESVRMSGLTAADALLVRASP